MMLVETAKQVKTSDGILLLGNQLDFDNSAIKFADDPKRFWWVEDAYQFDREKDPLQAKFWPEEEEMQTEGIFLIVGNETKKHGHIRRNVFIPRFVTQMPKTGAENETSFCFQRADGTLNSMTVVFDKSKNIRFLIVG